MNIISKVLSVLFAFSLIAAQLKSIDLLLVLFICF